MKKIAKIEIKNYRSIKTETIFNINLMILMFFQEVMMLVNPMSLGH